MDWMSPSSFKRRSRKKRAHFGKSTSEPNLLDHFTPRFPDNLTHLLHEYVTVDELKFYRKRRPADIGDEFHNKDTICLYDQNQPITPFAALKTEYTKKFGRPHSLRSRSVPNKFDLNATTKELLDALTDDFSSEPPKRAQTAKISGEIEIEKFVKDQKPSEAADDSKVDKKVNEGALDTDNRRTCSFKVSGEVSYSPDLRGEIKGHTTMSSIPQLNNLKFYGSFEGTPEYRSSYKTYNHFTKSAPIKQSDNLRVSPVTVNTAIVSPNIAPLSEYTDKFQELNLHNAERQKLSKQISNVAMRNNLMIGHSDQHVFPEYFESFKNPNINKLPSRPKPRSPILSLSGSMDYNPEYRVKFTDFPRRRPVTHHPESNFDFLEKPRQLSPVHNAINVPKFNPHVAIVEPSVNLPPTIDKDPHYLCQPEVRKARREILLKKRPPSPSQTISAAFRNSGRIYPMNDDDETHKRYNSRNQLVKSATRPSIQVTVENVDEPFTKSTTFIQTKSPIRHGRRSETNSHAKRNLSKIIEGNYEYTARKKSSLTSTTTDDEFGGHSGRKLVNSKSFEAPSFVVLKDPCKQNKWMKSSWYL